MTLKNFPNHSEWVQAEVAITTGAFKERQRYWEKLQEDCAHPHLRHYSGQGYTGWICSICGYYKTTVVDLVGETDDRTQ